MKYVTTDSCVACGRMTDNGNALHHIKTRKSGGTDDSWNMIPTCFSCHTKYHSQGLVYMAEKHPRVKKWLLDHEWGYDEFLKKWVRYADCD